MGRTIRRWVWVTVVLAGLGASGAVRADDVRVAVAANFALTLQRLAAAFEASTGHRIVPSAASTGQLYAQIRAGAPFDVFLSADQERPAQLEKHGYAVAGTRFVYARGRLALWSRRPGWVTSSEVLASPQLRAIALADPRTAPYGRAARRFLQDQGLWERLDSHGRLAVSTSVTHAYQFAATGAAELGFVALSQVLHAPHAGSYWLVPTAVGALDQEAVLLRDAAHKPAARAWIAFLAKDPRARALIEADGYGVP